MPNTFAQKAIARAAGMDDVAIGQVVDARPDVVLSHDNTAAIRQIWLGFGQNRVVIPERMVITMDHAVPAPSTQHALNHAEIRTFVKEQGIRHAFPAGRGICHQVISEEALVLPGQMLLGSDSHCPHFGWMGAFGAGIGRSEVAVLWATGELWLRVPESMQVVLRGDLPLGVTSKDFALRLIGDLGGDGGLYRSIEFTGDGIKALSPHERMTLPNMMSEFGAKTAYIAPDTPVFAYLAERKLRREQGLAYTAEVDSGVVAEEMARIAEHALYPDEGATYSSQHVYDAADLEPYVACPHTVDNVVPISQIAGTPVQQAFIGTCTNGRLEDVAAAASILANHSIAPGTRLLVIPSSRQVLQEAMRLGYIQTLVDAGAMIGNTTVAAQGASTLITFTGGESALLVGIDSANVTAADFLFA